MADQFTTAPNISPALAFTEHLPNVAIQGISSQEEARHRGSEAWHS